MWWHPHLEEPETIQHKMPLSIYSAKTLSKFRDLVWFHSSTLALRTESQRRQCLSCVIRRMSLSSKPHSFQNASSQPFRYDRPTKNQMLIILTESQFDEAFVDHNSMIFKRLISVTWEPQLQKLKSSINPWSASQAETQYPPSRLRRRGWKRRTIMRPEGHSYMADLRPISWSDPFREPKLLIDRLLFLNRRSQF